MQHIVSFETTSPMCLVNIILLAFRLTGIAQNTTSLRQNFAYESHYTNEIIGDLVSKETVCYVGGKVKH